MLENVITNPIETPRGYKNPGHGIALRGPLSQFFSGFYLKPLDDAFDNIYGGGKTESEHQKREQVCIVPHPRTLRKAREQVRVMVLDGLSAQRIRSYLHRWVAWWATTSNTWQYQELLQWFMDVCWHETTRHTMPKASISFISTNYSPRCCFLSRVWLHKFCNFEAFV